MLSIGKLGTGSDAARYYLDLAKANYYIDSGEPPGLWLGQGSRQLGLTDKVTDQELIQLMQGFHPDTGDPLTQTTKKHNAGWDLTFSAPKSVSIAWAMANAEIRKSIEEAQLAAVKKALSYLEEQAITRLGKGGIEREKPAGLIAAAFQHSTSRENDPQLHTHALIANVCQRADGSTGTIESSPLFAHKMTAGAIYRSELASLLRIQGFQLEEDSKDSFRITGISQECCLQFSKRRDAIESYLEERGLHDAKSSALATLATRSSKTESSLAEKISEWREEAKRFGIDEKAIELLQTHTPTTKTPPTIQEILTELTETSSTFREQDIVRLIAVKAQTSDFDREAMLNELKESNKILPLSPYSDGQKRYTSKEMWRIEQGILEKALAGKSDISHQLQDKLIEDEIAGVAVKKGFELNQEQADAVRHITMEAGVLACIEGMAGTGKTTVLETINTAYTKAGFQVIGCALSGKAAEGLEEGSGISSSTIHSLLYKLDQKEILLSSRSVIVIDEAGMVGSRLYNEIITHTSNAGAKLVLVGDYRQLQPIDAGGMFKQIALHVGSAELVEIRRQKEDWHKEAIHHIVSGEASQAISAFQARGLLHVSDDRSRAIEQMVDDWFNDPTALPEKLMLAGTRYECRLCNELARALHKKEGALDSAVSTRVKGGDDIEREFCLGDRVLFTKNNLPLGVKNGTIGRLESIEIDAHGDIVFQVITDSSETITFRPKDYNDLHHGYCVSVHKSQGATVDKTYLLTNERMTDREWTYVGVSRSRFDTQIYTTEDEIAGLAQRVEASHQKDVSVNYDGQRPYCQRESFIGRGASADSYNKPGGQYNEQSNF